MSRDEALTVEIQAVLRSDLMTSRARDADEMRAAALASLASLVPGAEVSVTVEADPDKPARLRIDATIVRRRVAGTAP